MIRLVLFDIDGTLLHTHHAGIKAFDRALQLQFKLQDATRGLQFAGRTDTGLVRELFARHGVEPSKKNFQLFFDCYVNLLQEMLGGCNGSICPGAVELIREMKALRKPPVIGLLTGNIRLGAELKLRHFNLWEQFVMGAFADDHEDRNQIAAVAFERGSRLLGGKLRGDETVVIGDTPLDIACGRAIGAKVLAVATGGSTLAELQAHQPDWNVPDLTHLNAREICGR